MRRDSQETQDRNYDQEQRYCFTISSTDMTTTEEQRCSGQWNHSMDPPGLLHHLSTVAPTTVHARNTREEEKEVSGDEEELDDDIASRSESDSVRAMKIEDVS